MPAIRSSVDPGSEAFEKNRAAMLAAIDGFRELERRIEAAAEKARPAFQKRGQLLPRERLDRLLDPGAPWLELSTLAGYRLYHDKDGSAAGGGLIGGIGWVSGIRSVVIVNNSAIKGGSISPIGLKKLLRLQDVALENRLPVVTLVESGGADLNYADEFFVEGGRMFANEARLSAAGIPQFDVVHGSSTAGGAYLPALCDYVVVVRGRSKMFLAGPPLLRAATGEIATDEELGGAELHASVAGTAEYLAEDDADGIRIVRELMARIPWNEGLPGAPARAFREPLHPAEELLGIVPADPRQPYDVRELIARIADGSDFLEFKESYDAQTICGHASVQGHKAGLIGNNAPITTRGATKAAQFIQLCEQGNVPVIFLHNTTGFMVGTESEREGIIKHGTKLIQAVANARVPRLSIVVGGSYGAGNYAMCGRGFDPRFIFAWPNSKVGIMGGAQAGAVLRMVAEEKHARQGQAADPAMLEQLQRTTAEKLESTSTALANTARLHDDGIIDPRDTRVLLGLLLDVCREAEVRTVRPNTFGVAKL
jgi:geranyl-CoA carboxylase beta subunit